MQALYDRLHKDIAAAYLWPCSQLHSFTAVRTDIRCLQGNQWQQLDLCSRGVLLSYQADRRVGLRWRFGGFSLGSSFVLEPDVRQLPLNDEHVLFVPALHDLEIFSSVDCELTFSTGCMKHEVYGAIWSCCQNMVISPCIVVKCAREMLGSSHFEHPLQLHARVAFHPEDKLGETGWLGQEVLVSNCRKRILTCAATHIQQAFRAHLEKYGRAARIIQRNWRFAISCPSQRICQSRLLKEFDALRVSLGPAQATCLPFPGCR